MPELWKTTRFFLPAHFVFADTVHQRRAPALFSRSRARSEKNSAKARRKKSAKKAKAPSAKEKSANLRFFLPHTVEIRFQSPKPLGRRGKARVLSKMYMFSRYACPFLPVLLFQSCSVLPIFSAYPTVPVLFCLPCAACSVLPAPVCPVLPVLFCLSCAACSVLPVPVGPVPPVLFCLSCSSCPALPIPFCRSVLFCLSCFCQSCPDCPVLTVLSW